MSKEIETSSVSPGCSSRVFAKPASSCQGFFSLPSGAVTYACTTCLPAIAPAFFTSTVSITRPASSSTHAPSSENSVYESPNPKGYIARVPTVSK